MKFQKITIFIDVVINIKNALFVGSTAELQKMLNKKSVETNVERKKENENFEGKNITPEKKNTKD